MGQYYKPCFLSERFRRCKKYPVKASLCSWDFSNGAKLMEHSYIGNSFVGAVMYLLANDHNSYRFAWVGDYADGYKVNGTTVDLYSCAELTEKETYNLYFKGNYECCNKEYKYLYNYTTHEYIKLPKWKSNIWKIHPLPILCAVGNGRGGGDYRGKLHEKEVGVWAFHHIGAGDTLPNGIKWKQRIFDFTDEDC